jgi:hypothetical protein
LWLFAAALLLKAAMPMLATASAQLQGKALVEVCTVYGVATVALDSHSDTPAPHQKADHEGAHCGLSGLMAWSHSSASTPLFFGVAATSPSPPTRQPSVAPDASATWVAQLHHGPPALT